MAKSFVQELGERLASVESRLSSLSSGNRLDHASLDGTTLYLRDYDGNLSGRLGRQPDGSNGVHVVKVQPPPQLTAAILTVGEQAGTCLVEWDGRTFDGRRMPLIHGHTEIWAELVGEDWSPTVAPGGSAKRVGTIRDRMGGEVVVALPQTGTWAVWLRAMGADRETAGPWSPVATVEITPLVDTEAIEAELDQARQDIQEADQRLTAGQDALTGHLDNLNDVRLPALEQDISNAVSQATADIQDFENRWDAQWDDTIPALADRQDTLVGELADGLTQVHNQAEALAEAARDEAVNMAAADAQSEYDRLQEIAERALSRAGDNVLEDPSFETNYWYDFFNNFGNQRFYFTPTSTEPRTGDQAMAITRSDDTIIAVNHDFVAVDVEPDESWRISVWYRTEGDIDLDQGSYPARLRIRNAVNNEVIAESDNLVPGSEYHRAVFTYTVPAEGVEQIMPALRVNHTQGTLIIDDVTFQEVGAAAEALRLAEVARQEAEAAHIAAGDAEDAAANAYAAASSKSTVHWSLSAPSGTADNSDDVWWQYELRNGRRVVIGQWFWDDGVWRETEIAEEWLPQVNIGTGTYGDLHGDRMTANTVRAGTLAVMPDTEDFAPDPSRDPELWDLAGAAISGQISSWAAENPSGVTIRLNQRNGNSQVRGPMRQVTPGKQIRFRGIYSWFGGSDVGADTQIRMEWYNDPDGSRLSFDTFASISNGLAGHWVEGIVTVPSDASHARLYIFQTSVDTSNDAVIMGTIQCEPMVGAVLIEDGAVKAQHVDSVDLTASNAFLDNAMVNLIQGRMANFDEALIGGALLKDNSISAGKLTVMPDGADFAPGPGGYEDLWTVGSNNAIVTSSDDPSGAQLRVSPGGGAGNSTRTYGPWLRAQAGDTIYYRMYVGRTDSPDAALRIYFMYDGSVTSWDRVWEENASGWVEGVHTVSDGVESTVTLSFVTSGGTQGNYWIQNMDVRKQVKGVLIEPEGIKSPQVDTQEFFAAQAVIDEVWTNIVRSRLVESQGIITEDMIATGAITTPKLTVTEELVGEIAKLIRIEAGSLASNDIEAMRIVSSLIEATTYLIHDADGDVSVRLDGVANYIAGRLRAGMAEGSSISLDYGEKVRFSGLNEEGEPDPIRVISTPYLNFHTTNVTYQENQEPSIHLERGNPSGRDGMMIINPGYPEGTPPFRGLLNVVGDVVGNQVRSREWSYSQYGFSVPSDNPNLTTALSRESSGGTYLAGRHHGASQTRARDSFWVSDQYELAAGARRRRFFTWGAPPPTGERSPILSVRLTEAASDRNAYVVVNSSHHTNTGYAVNEYNPSSARATYYVYQLAVWEDA